MMLPPKILGALGIGLFMMLIIGRGCYLEKQLASCKVQNALHEASISTLSQSIETQNQRIQKWQAESERWKAEAAASVTRIMSEPLPAPEHLTPAGMEASVEAMR